MKIISLGSVQPPTLTQQWECINGLRHVSTLSLICKTMQAITFFGTHNNISLRSRHWYFGKYATKRNEVLPTSCSITYPQILWEVCRREKQGNAYFVPRNLHPNTLGSILRKGLWYSFLYVWLLILDSRNPCQTN